MKQHTTLLALCLVLALTVVPTTFAIDGEPTDSGFDVIQWITDGLDALWSTLVDDSTPTPPPAGDEAAGDNGPDDGSDEFGPELVPIG
ncbi:MAG: hypothetical protein AAGE94_13020 [Acidobacteriota bacterium]